jgi:hypothetical protein
MPIFVFKIIYMRQGFLNSKRLLLIGKRHKFISFVAFFLLLVVFGYIAQLNQPPQSTHLWRQSDCASLALNYYQHGMELFKPQIHNLHADGHTTGYATSECPYLYYTVAAFYKIFGPSHWVYRIVWSIIVLLGFFATYRFFLSFLESKIISFLGATIILISPVIVFYGNSFLPDVPAFMFVLVGWMFFARWQKHNQKRTLWLVAILFMLGGLLKVTALISFFALAGVWFLELLGVRLGENGKPIFKHRWSSLIPFVVIFAIVVAWYVWAWHYNAEHSTKYFSMRTCPIWNVSSCCNCGIADILRQVNELWLPHLFSKPVLILLLICIVLVGYYYRFANRFLLAITAFTFLGTSLYIAIWFAAFFDHDYYFINLYIFPFFLMLTALDVVSKRFPRVFSSRYFLLLLVAFAVYGTHYTYMKQRLRYKGWMNYEHRQFADIREAASYIDDLGIDPDDKIISIPDRTPDYTLYLLNRKGWTLYGDQAVDSLSLAKRIEGGAKFLFVTNYSQTVQERPYIKPFLNQPIGELNGLRIYRIDGQPHSKVLTQRIDTVFHLKCNAETIAQGDLLATSNPSYLAKGSENLTVDISLSGSQSLLVDSSNPFGFTIEIPVQPNTNVEVSVWRNSKDDVGELVVSGKRSSTFYQSKGSGEVDPETGWELISTSVSISPDFKEKHLVVYVWNPHGQPAHFDDLEILVTQNTHTVTSRRYVSE